MGNRIVAWPLMLVFFYASGMSFIPSCEVSMAVDLYNRIIFPCLQRLEKLRGDFKERIIDGNIHALFAVLATIRACGFVLVREYRLFEVRMQEYHLSREAYGEVLHPLVDFVTGFMGEMIEQIEDFFKPEGLADVFRHEGIDWTEPFSILASMLVDCAILPEKAHQIKQYTAVTFGHAEHGVESVQAVSRPGPISSGDVTESDSVGPDDVLALFLMAQERAVHSSQKSRCWCCLWRFC